jgi:phenylalanyl-tRNA synthetase beta chain
MKISYNWLKNYIKTELSPVKLSEILTSTGLEVEGIEKIEAVAGGLQGVVVGHVLSCEKHENADKLQVTQVDIGSGEPQQIVCGAPNVAVGQKVLVATVGTTLYPQPGDSFKIKAAKIRGVESNGMICAEDELGIGVSHDGIMVLPNDAEIGQHAAQFLELEDDYLIEIGLTPNRSDAMGHIGVARDVVAYLNFHEQASLPLNLPEIHQTDATINSSHPVKVSVQDPILAPRYCGVTISNVNVAPSPNWLQKALRTIGLTPINNIVDITNYVLHELGTPLHAFDQEAVGDQLIVRRAQKGEKLTTLDEIERELDEDDLLITNGKEPLCIAGVFGGIHSGVSEKTTCIFLEAAYFNPVSIRKTAKRHGLNTDASFRFERGVDPNRVDYALQRAIQLILEIAGGNLSMEVVDLYPTPILPLEIPFRFDRCNAVIGQKIEQNEVLRLLENLDFQAKNITPDGCLLITPTYRTDVTREIDIIEEVLRIYGFNKVELPKKLNMCLPQAVDNKAEKAQAKITEMLVAKGFSEMMNNSLTQSSYIEKLGGSAFQGEQNVAMLNPLSQELDILRRTLIFQALESYAYNQNRQHPDVQLFEFGKTYHHYASGYSENKRLVLLISGRLKREGWNTTSEKQSFFSLKGTTEAILQRLGLFELISYQGIKKSLLADGLSIQVTNKKVGEIGWVDQKTKKHFGIKQDVFIADLDWDMLCDCLKMNTINYQEIPKTFAVRRDFSLLLNSDTAFGEIQKIAQSKEKKLLRDVHLFDVYEGDQLPHGKKSYAVSFTFQDAEKTLKDEQVDGMMLKIRQGLEQELGAELRS